MRSIGLVLCVGFAVVLLVYGGWLPVSEVGAEEQATTEGAGEWPMYRRDLAATGFSPLAQITTTNVTGLTQAWTYSLEAATEGGRGPNSQVTPIVVNGVMYLPAADRVVALDPTTGRELWRHRIAEGSPSRRGVAYWPGGNGLSPRIIFTTGQ